ncbi:DUF418 domain-containing protein [Streptomyces sp. NPDC026665]|uniref:DUF418 domain-containing protein n=1 Tax=Streptomyces sp. NPDC026665 TaxID=3154798 RepID=UPI003411CF79
MLKGVVSQTTEACESGSRITEIDAIRGFALLGICMVNASTISGDYQFHPSGAVSALDEAAELLVSVLFETKFYLLFSFLFGYSFVLQMQASQRMGTSFARRHLRRLTGLLLFGSVHAVLLYPGDILTTYAVLGLLLFGMRGARPRTALMAAAALFTILAASFFVVGVQALGMKETSDGKYVAMNSRIVALYRGSFSDVVSANTSMFREMLIGATLYSAHVFGAFLVGFAAGKCGVLDRPELLFGKWRARTRGVCILGLLLGLPGAVFMAMTEYGPLSGKLYYMGRASAVLTAPALTAAYVCCLLLVLRGRLGKYAKPVLAFAGRMSLSNYLGQSLVLALIFTGYGFGQYANVGPAALVLICLLLYGVQLAFSTWLMARRRSGPMEALLRRITGKRWAADPERW